jgi:outer membrane protein OmpA-like peptidoglycan-associated protein
MPTNPSTSSNSSSRSRCGIVLLGLAFGASGCAEILASRSSSDSSKPADSKVELSLKAQNQGRIEEAIGLARAAVTDARASSETLPLAIALQQLGGVLAEAEFFDEAESVAKEQDSLATHPKGENTWSAIALAKCDFAGAADFQLRLRELTPDGINDRPVEANLALFDHMEGRFGRALERLEHVMATPNHARSTKLVNDSLASEVPVALAKAKCRLGETTQARQFLSQPQSYDPVQGARQLGAYALANRRALFRAYGALVDAVLLAKLRGESAAFTDDLKQLLRSVLNEFRARPSNCRQVVGDPIAMEAPANRPELFPWLNEQVATPAPAVPAPEATPVLAVPLAEPGYLAGREVHLKEQIPFQFDSAKILPSGAPTLDWLAAFLRAHPELGTVSIEGHTDDQGSDAYNLDLSNRRARSVVDALNARGVGPTRLSSPGFGKRQPKLLGTDETARRANRRVEIIVSGTVPRAAAETTPVTPKDAEAP